MNDRLPNRPSILLAGKLLEEVQRSIKVFKPSPSLSLLTELSDKVSTRNENNIDQNSNSTVDIDVVISGGGLKGYYTTGCMNVLSAELEKGRLRIARIAGASAGAWAAMLYCCGLTTAQWIETYYYCKEFVHGTIHDAYEGMWIDWLSSILPEDAYKKCQNKLFVSITVLRFVGGIVPTLHNVMVSDFNSNDDMFEACLASSTIPFLSQRGGIRQYRGMWVLDGALTNNLPVFPDYRRRQLVLNLSEVEYSVRLIALHQDDCIEMLVLRGAMQMSHFLQGIPNSNKAISWVERRKYYGGRNNTDNMTSTSCSESSKYTTGTNTGTCGAWSELAPYVSWCFVSSFVIMKLHYYFL